MIKPSIKWNPLDFPPKYGVDQHGNNYTVSIWGQSCYVITKQGRRGDGCTPIEALSNARKGEFIK